MSLYQHRVSLWIFGISVGALAALPACTTDVARSSQSSAPAIASPDERAAQTALAAMTSAGPLQHDRVVSRDSLGNARVVLGAGTTIAGMPGDMRREVAARLHLLRNAKLLGVNEASLHDTLLESAHPLAGGATILQFGQRVRGVEVFHARASVIVDANNNLISLSNSLAPAQLRTHKSQRSQLGPAAALTKAYAAAAAADVTPDAVSEIGSRTDGWHDYTLATATTASRVLEASAKPVMFRDQAALVPAYHVELLTRAPGSSADHAHGYVVAASDGNVLWHASLTASDAFSYRVWADANGLHTPTDGPIADYAPHPTGVPDRAQPGFVPPTLVSTEGFNKNPQGAADPWLTASDTFTFGNNVRAYSDRNQYDDSAGMMRKDGFDEGVDFRAELTAPLTFDRQYDPTHAPDYDSEQIKAAVTQLFYTTNWLHDYFYDSGFNETGHNAQQSNYGRGGVEGDPLKAEAQDSAESGASNNANMSTLSDGKSPRMQMYVWSGLPNRVLDTSAGVTFDDGFGSASYGPQTFDLGAQMLPLVLVDDNSTAIPPDGTAPGTVTDGCQAAPIVKGKIAVVDRGGCTFVAKLTSLQSSGAVAVLVLDNAPGHAPPNPSAANTMIKIPLLSISYEDGQKLKAALAAAGETPVVATKFLRGPEVERDGTIDNTVVAHEWGHYLHHRLVLCGSASCDGMSEGWGDFNALMLTIREGDTFAGKVYPLAQYAAGGLGASAAYFGIRRAPYSVELTKNPFTFQHIRKAAKLPTTAPLSAAGPDMSEPHNVGEIWAQTLFEGYVNLLTAGQAAGRTFDESKRRMADYVVAGMKATPVEPTFTEQRDAILSTVAAMAKSDPSRQVDFSALASGFAKRGLGVGAVAPPTSSKTLNEAVENFDVKGSLELRDVELDDSVRSCDADGHLDAGESGVLTVRLVNGGWATLSNTSVKVMSSDPSLTVGNAGLVTLPPLEPYAEASITLPVSSVTGAAARGLLKLTITPSDPDAYKPSVDLPIELLYNYDDVPQSAATDDCESAKPAWSVPTNVLAGVWSQSGDAENHVWHGDDMGARSDESLVSPDLVVSAVESFVISFRHRYAFELNPASATGPDVAFDGGVLEISEDGGASWTDVSTYADPRYTQTVYSTAADGGADDPDIEPDSNALAGRKAWGGESSGYPDYERVSIDLGTKLAGKTVKIRFRIGTDEGAGAPGWDIDDLAFGTGAASGITNTPFSSIRDDAAACEAPPAAQ